MPIFTFSHCIICYKWHDSKSPTLNPEQNSSGSPRTWSNRNGEICHRFGILSSRYLDLDPFLYAPEKTARTKLGVHFDTVCDLCVPMLSSFCDLYNQWKCLEMQMNLRLQEISEAMRQADVDVDGTHTEFRKQMEVKFKETGVDPDGLEELDDFRREFLGAALEKKGQFTPQLKLKKTGDVTIKKTGAESLHPPETCEDKFIVETEREINETGTDTNVKGHLHHDDDDDDIDNDDDLFYELIPIKIDEATLNEKGAESPHPPETVTNNSNGNPEEDATTPPPSPPKKFSTEDEDEDIVEIERESNETETSTNVKGHLHHDDDIDDGLFYVVTELPLKKKKRKKSQSLLKKGKSIGKKHYRDRDPTPTKEGQGNPRSGRGRSKLKSRTTKSNKLKKRKIETIDLVSSSSSSPSVSGGAGENGMGLRSKIADAAQAHLNNETDSGGRHALCEVPFCGRKLLTKDPKSRRGLRYCHLKHDGITKIQFLFQELGIAIPRRLNPLAKKCKCCYLLLSKIQLRDDICSNETEWSIRQLIKRYNTRIYQKIKDSVP